MYEASYIQMPNDEWLTKNNDATLTSMTIYDTCMALTPKSLLPPCNHIIRFLILFEVVM
jgi:hypothetical protein